MSDTFVSDTDPIEGRASELDDDEGEDVLQSHPVQPCLLAQGEGDDV